MFIKRSHLLNRILSLVLIVSLFLPGFSPLVHADNSIYSKASDWAKVEIESAESSGVLPPILKGKDMTKFATREELCELAVLLYEKLNGETLKSSENNPFNDTKNVQIIKAYELGITTGTSSTTFEPNSITNREQVATMFGRAVEGLYPNMDYSGIGAPNFTDKADISSWALSHVMFLSKEGIIEGYAGKFMSKPITVAQKQKGYGMTTREQAIAITVRIYSKYKDEKVEKPNPLLGDKEKAALSLIEKPGLLLTEKPGMSLSEKVSFSLSEEQNLAKIDFNTRVFNPIYKPKLKLLIASSSLPGGNKSFTSAPYSVLVRKDINPKHSFKWELPADVLSQTNKIIWEVSAIPFDGSPIENFSKIQPGVLVTGSTSKTTNSFQVDFEKVAEAERIPPKFSIPKLNTSTLSSPLLNASKVNDNFIKLPTLIDPSKITLKPTQWSINDILIAEKPIKTSQKIYYVRAYPVNSSGASIGDAGSGTAVLYGDPQASQISLSKIASFAFSLKSATRAGAMYVGTEFPNIFPPAGTIPAYIKPTDSREYHFLPSGFLNQTQELIIQVSLKEYTSTGNDSWMDVPGLVYQQKISLDESILKDFASERPQGIRIDFTDIVPPMGEIPEKNIPYYIRMVALREGVEKASVNAQYSGVVTLVYGTSTSNLRLFPEVIIDPPIPKVTSIAYTHNTWERYDWMYHYVVISQPTYGDIFGDSNNRTPYKDWSVGTELDLTPKPKNKSWWDKLWDAVTSFFSNVWEFAKKVANWVSTAYADIKSGVIKFVLKAFPPLGDPFDGYLEKALTMMANYGLMVLGLPPTLPNFDELSEMGTDYLVSIALEQASDIAGEAYKDAAATIRDEAKKIEEKLPPGAAEKIAGELKKEMKSSSNKSTPNPMKWEFVKHNPKYLYKPATIMIEIRNDTGRKTARGELSCYIYGNLDMTQKMQNQHIAYLNIRTNSTWIEPYQPVRGIKVPALNPGQKILIPIYLKEYIGISIRENGPVLTAEDFMHMTSVGKMKFNINFSYDLPPISEAMKSQGILTVKDTLYHYKEGGTNFGFETELNTNYNFSQ